MKNLVKEALLDRRRVEDVQGGLKTTFLRNVGNGRKERTTESSIGIRQNQAHQDFQGTVCVLRTSYGSMFADN